MICEDKNLKDNLCSKYEFNDAEFQILNSNEIASNTSPKWKYDLFNPQLLNLNVLVDNVQIICEKSKKTDEKYIKDTCFMKYSLRKGSNYKENGDKTQIDKSERNGKESLLIALYILLGLFGALILLCCFVCCVIPNKYCCPNCTDDDKINFFGECIGKCCERMCTHACTRF